MAHNTATESASALFGPTSPASPELLSSGTKVPAHIFLARVVESLAGITLTAEQTDQLDAILKTLPAGASLDDLEQALSGCRALAPVTLALNGLAAEGRHAQVFTQLAGS